MNCRRVIEWQWQTPEQQQNFAIPVKITDEIGNMSTIKRVCLHNSGFDIKPYGINSSLSFYSYSPIIKMASVVALTTDIFHCCLSQGSIGLSPQRTSELQEKSLSLKWKMIQGQVS